MTKSRTLRRAGAVVLSLAMAATTVFAGGVDSQAASKVTLSSTKKTFAAKGGTATVKIKGATSAKISSTTVKSSKTSVATVKKSSKVKFKVTAKKNTTTSKKKATITAKVKIAKKYQSKYTKKSYTLKYKVTVKAAAVTPTEAPVVELKLDKVESAAGATNNILIAYFSSKVAAIEPTDVQIRRVSDDQLFTVEKVVMGNGNTTATMTLSNTNAGGATVEGLAVNTDYKMIVTQGDKVAEKVFSIPAVASETVVTAFNKDKKSITTAGGKNNGTFTDTQGLIADYNDLLGRTVTLQYNKNKEITKLNVAEETVVYGAFKGLDEDGKVGASKVQTQIQDVVTEEKYDLVATTTTGSSIYETRIVNLQNSANNFAKTSANATTTTVAAWAKVTLNGNGSVRSVVYTASLDGYTLVDKVDGNIAFCGKDETSFKDYTFLKDGKTATIDDTVGNTVFYEGGFAVIGTNMVKGAIKEVYTTKFTVGEKSFDYTDSDPKNSYFDNGLKALTADQLNKFKSSGKDVTVYTGIDGSCKIVSGEEGVTPTEDQTIILTATATDNNNAEYKKLLYLKGYDVATKKSDVFTVDVDKLTDSAIVTAAGAKTAKTVDAGTATISHDTKIVVGQDIDYADLTVGNIVTLTKVKETGVITGITTQRTTALASIDGENNPTVIEKFKKGAKVMNGYPVASDCTVFTLAYTSSDGNEWNDDVAAAAFDSTSSYADFADAISLDATRTTLGGAEATDKEGTKATLLDFKIATKDGEVKTIFIGKDNRKAKASSAVLGNSLAWGDSSEKGDAVTGVVKEFIPGTGTGEGRTPSSLTIVTPAGEETYKSWKDENAIPADAKVKGAIVTVTGTKADPKKVFSISADVTSATVLAGSGALTNYTSSSIDVNGDTWTLFKTYTVYKVTAEGVEKALWKDVEGAAKLYVRAPANVTQHVIEIAVIS